MSLGSRLRISPSGSFQFNRFFDSKSQFVTPDAAALEAFRIDQPPNDSFIIAQVEVLSSNIAAPAEVAGSTRSAFVTTGDTGLAVLQGAPAESVTEFNGLGIVTPGFIEFSIDPATNEIIITLETGVAKEIKHDLFITTDLQVPVVG